MMLKIKLWLFPFLLGALCTGIGFTSISTRSNPLSQASQKLNEKIADRKSKSEKTFISVLDISDKEVLDNIYETVKDMDMQFIGLTNLPSGQDICNKIGYINPDLEWQQNNLNSTGWNSSLDSSNSKGKCLYRINSKNI